VTSCLHQQPFHFLPSCCINTTVSLSSRLLW
jgi:hypothetical protein